MLVPKNRRLLDGRIQKKSNLLSEMQVILLQNKFILTNVLLICLVTLSKIMSREGTPSSPNICLSTKSSMVSILRKLIFGNAFICCMKCWILISDFRGFSMTGITTDYNLITIVTSTNSKTENHRLISTSSSLITKSSILCKENRLKKFCKMNGFRKILWKQ